MYITVIEWAGTLDEKIPAKSLLVADQWGKFPRYSIAGNEWSVAFTLIK